MKSSFIWLLNYIKRGYRLGEIAARISGTRNIGAPKYIVFLGHEDDRTGKILRDTKL